MARFTPSQSHGGDTPYRIFYIASATAIQKGELVKFTPGTGVVAVAGTDFDDPFLGSSLEEHDGSSENQTGTEIKIACSPLEVFQLQSTNALTLTGGSTTTAVIAGLLPQTDNLWIGGYVEVVTCASGIPAGTMIPISDSTGATGTLTFAEQASAFAADDTIILHPGKLAVGEYGWDLDANGTDIDYTSSGGEALVLVDADPKHKKAYFAARLHQFGNDAAAK